MAADLTAQSKFPKRELAIIIKCLNEEKHIAKCVASAVEAIADLDAVVVVADSGSTDRTVEIASEFPVNIVQLSQPEIKSCGLGAQLGYQYVDCDYVYILDGDMTLQPDALKTLREALRNDLAVAGIAGTVEEMGGVNYEFERRRDARDGAVVGDVSALDMGGLYRTQSLMDGYLTNLNLHSYEEKELSYRLQKAGHGLKRIDIPAVRHFGKTQDTASLLSARWKSRHIDGSGELSRFLLTRGSSAYAFKAFGQLIIVALVWLLAIGAVVALPVDLRIAASLAVTFASAQMLLLLRFVLRDRSLKQAGVALANINILAAAWVRGVLRRQRSPTMWIPSQVVK